MASFSTCFSFLFFASLFLSLPIDARDSQFFSKVTHVNDNNINNNVVKETELPKKEEPVNKPEEQPVFHPETESSYGLYGHESGQFPPTTTTPTSTYEPYKTESEENTNRYPNEKYYYNNDAYNTNQDEMRNREFTGANYNNNNNNNKYYYKKDAYGGYSSMENQNNNQKYYYSNNAANGRYNDHNVNAAVNDRYNYNNNAANNRYNAERQGMSDTRFLEGGKYFYDLNSEKYNPTSYGDSSRGVSTRNWGNNRVYFGNNNGKSYGNNNFMEGNQNQEEFEEEQEEFEP